MSDDMDKPDEPKEVIDLATALIKELGGLRALQVAGTVIFMIATHEDNASPDDFLTTIFDDMRKRVRQATYDA